MADLTFFYQLQNATYSDLVARSFELGVIDDVDSGITAAQVQSLAAADKDLWAYTSVGEAANFHEYWTNGNWDTNPPSFLIGQNPNWPSAYRVKFWDTDWQDIAINRAVGLINKGYSGVYLDVVDAYNVPEVRTAFDAEFPGGDIAYQMEQFVIKLANAVHAASADARVVVQNAVGLLTNTPVVNPTDPLDPNMDFINAIDGVGKESTFSLNDVYPIPWGPWDARYVENILSVPGKFVIGLEYPSTQAAQDYSLQQMVAAGYIPYFDTQQHDGNFLPINYQTGQYVSAAQLALLKDSGTTTTPTVPGGTGTDDNIVGTDASETLSGEAGNDTIYGLNGDDTIDGGDGDDSLLGWNGNDSITGGAGRDTIFGDAGNDTLSGGAENDYMYGWTGDDLINGGAGDDVLYADQGNDTVYTGEGNDIVYGADGNDWVQGAGGNDFIYGDGGNDTITGDAGNDRLYGWTGNDSLSGGAGDDALSGDQDADTIDGGSGSDTIYAGSGNDSVLGGTGDDWMFLDGGNDTAYGGEGRDVFFAWEGDDQLFGQGGNDFISAEGGNDLINGGNGDDEMYGGTGSDQFVHNVGETGINTIRDFEIGIDKVHLVGFVGDFDSLITPNLFYAGSNATLVLDTNHSITFDNVVAGGGLSASDFVFA